MGILWNVIIGLRAIQVSLKWKVNRLKGLKTVFENEEAVRLLNYFISYKEMISKTENKKWKWRSSRGAAKTWRNSDKIDALISA